jgi:hypothetical protein
MVGIFLLLILSNTKLLYLLCGQPGQQHGRRLPSCRFWVSCLILLTLVSDFFADMIQQIHSLRASGVRDFQIIKISGVEVRICLRSGGVL